MDFHLLSLREIEKARPYFLKMKTRLCDFTCGTMFMWRKFYKIEVSYEKEALHARYFDVDGKPYYNIPIAEDIPGEIKKLDEEVGSDESFQFTTVPEEMLGYFRETYPNCVITEMEDTFDYLYRASDLINLRGKKYHGQKNLVNKFKKTAGEWTFEPIDDSNVEDVIDFFSTKYFVAEDADDFELEENHRVFEVLRHMDVYKMPGAVLKADGVIVGFSIGECVNDTLYTHIEKADRHYKGAYQMVVNQFTSRFAGEGIEYVNREEDLGDAGLKIAKEAYHPVAHLKKYHVKIR